MILQLQEQGKLKLDDAAYLHSNTFFRRIADNKLDLLEWVKCTPGPPPRWLCSRALMAAPSGANPSFLHQTVQPSASLGGCCKSFNEGLFQRAPDATNGRNTRLLQTAIYQQRMLTCPRADIIQPLILGCTVTRSNRSRSETFFSILQGSRNTMMRSYDWSRTCIDRQTCPRYG